VAEAAGEAAFIVPVPELLDRSFGGTGALETFAAMPALPTHAPEGSALKTVSPAEIIAAARLGENEATATLQTWTRYVAIGLIAIGAICNPEMIVIGGGGGVGVYEMIQEPLSRYLNSHLPLPSRLACADLGDEAALWGSLVSGSWDCSDLSGLKIERRWQRASSFTRTPETYHKPRCTDCARAAGGKLCSRK